MVLVVATLVAVPGVLQTHVVQLLLAVLLLLHVHQVVLYQFQPAQWVTPVASPMGATTVVARSEASSVAAKADEVVLQLVDQLLLVAVQWAVATTAVPQVRLA